MASISHPSSLRPFLCLRSGGGAGWDGLGGLSKRRVAEVQRRGTIDDQRQQRAFGQLRGVVTRGSGWKSLGGHGGGTKSATTKKSFCLRPKTGIGLRRGGWPGGNCTGDGLGGQAG